MSKSYLVAGAKPWNRRVFEEVIAAYPGRWHLVATPEELTEEMLAQIRPRYVFFLHWSWKVPAPIVENHECVCFHMTDVPYGRGGSPLQNLILRGHRHTKLTALRMVEAFDAGPVYRKEDLCLLGSAEEIYIRACRLSAEMIWHIVETEPTPLPQTGEPTIFERRVPEQSRIPALSSLADLYDFIRMLDAPGYPVAFIEKDGFRYEFSRAALCDGQVVADVKISPIEEKNR